LIRSVTYLSTPFFQKIEQPRATRVHPSAGIQNIHNYYDLTQLTIADFTVHQATQSATRKLTPRVASLKTTAGDLAKRIGAVRSGVESCAKLWVALVKAKGWDWVPFVDNDAEVRKASAAYNNARSQLATDVAALKADIDTLSDEIAATLATLRQMLVLARHPSNSALVDKLIQFIDVAVLRVGSARANAQSMIVAAESFDVFGLLSALLAAVEGLLRIVADLLENDRVYQVMVLSAVHILQFFDDTLQTNGHYKALASRPQFDEEVRSRDRFAKLNGYRALRGALEPHEQALHRNFLGARTVAAFRRAKWNGFTITERHLTKAAAIRWPRPIPARFVTWRSSRTASAEAICPPRSPNSS
jgi:hypothetical protein